MAWNRLSCDSGAAAFSRRHSRRRPRRRAIGSETQLSMGTWVWVSGASAYGNPCRYRLFSPSDSP